MRYFAHIRRSSRLIRSTFAVFVLAWLQMAAVPCVMADSSPQPVAEEVMETCEGMGHESLDVPGAADTDGHHDCIYCPPAAADQAYSPSICVYPDRPQAEGGGHAQVGLGVVLAAADLRSFDPTIQRHLVQTLLYAATPQPRPLNLTYCVQLK